MSSARSRARKEAAARAAAPLPAVYATVLVRTAAGEVHARAVRLWETPPAWWSRSAEDQRRAWVTAFFARAVGLQPGETVSGAEVRVG